MITKIIDRPKGPWIQELLRKLEYLVVMNQMENKTETLVEYVKQEMEGVNYE